MSTSDRATPTLAWLLRALWLALPLAVGLVWSAAVDALADTPRAVAEVIAWAGWASGALALFAPRPWGLTCVQTCAGWALALSVFATWDADVPTALLAITTALASAVIARKTVIARWMVNGAAYGAELRLPLKHPRVIGMVLVPIAVVVTGAAIAVGPLLLADGAVLAGGLAVGLGAAIAALLGRSLHALSRRWLVLVPGGVVTHDPLTLAHAVLVPRALLLSIDPVSQSGNGVDGPNEDADLDLRLKVEGGTLLTMTDLVAFPVITRTRRGVDVTMARRVLVPLDPVAASWSEMARRGLPVAGGD